MNRIQFSHYYGLLLGLFFLGQFLVLPILTPLFIAMGASIKEIGIIMAVMGVTVIILEMPTGGLADQIGRKKLFIISLALNTASLLILCLLPSVIGAIVSMIFWGAGISMSSGTITAWFVETFNAKKDQIDLQQGFAIIAFRTNLMGATGALICSLVVFLGITFEFEEIDVYRIILLGGALCYALVIAISIVWVQEEKRFDAVFKQSFTELPKQIKTGVLAICHPILWRILMTGLLAIPLASAIEKFWQVEFTHLTQADPLPWFFGLVFAITLFLGSIAAKVTNHLCRLLKQQMGKVLFIGLVCQLVSVIALTMSDSITYFILFFIAFDFSLELGVSARNHLIANATQDKVRSTVDSIMSFISRLGGVFGTLLCALGASYLGLTNTWLVGAAIAGFAGLIFLSQALNHTDDASLIKLAD